MCATSARPASVSLHAARAALDELRARLAFERRDLLGDGGLRVGERVGRGGEGAVCRDLAQHAHPADVKHKQNLYQIRQ